MASKNQIDSNAFEADAEAVICRIKGSLSEVIAAVPTLSFKRATDLAVGLGIDSKLAWKISRFVDGTDPFAAARFIPGPSAMKIFLRAAARRHAPPEVISAAEKAFASFRQLVRAHAGNRKYFDMMVAAHATADRGSSDLEHRRLTFEGNSFVWGVQARTVFRTFVASPSADGESWDTIAVRGFIDFRAMRPGVAWRISRPYSVDKSHGIHTELVRRPLDPSMAADGSLPLMTEFCTRPLPEFRRGRRGERGFDYEFIESSVGNTARLTCITGEIVRQVEPRYPDPMYQDFCVSFPVRTPAEVLLFDVAIHEELFGGGGLQPMLFSDLFGGSADLSYGDTDRLPLHEGVESLGRGVDMAHTRDVPRYPELLRYAFAQAGWDPAKYELYRFRMRYPPLPSTIMLRAEKAPRPAG
jgi:hypothetical protein